MRKSKFSALVEHNVREQLEKAAKAVEYALASLEVPSDEEDAASIQTYIEEIELEGKRAFDMFTEEMRRVWPSGRT